MSRYPLFIVGSPRSGTSALVDAVLSVGYEGFREGSFLSLMWSIDQMIDRHYASFAIENAAVLVSAVDKSNLKNNIFDIFRRITSDLNQSHPWFDKTGNPEMIWAIPIIRRLWPTSIFIFAKRRAIENIISRMKKFPGHKFEYHCADWAKNMAAWRAIRKELPQDTAIEIDQQEMIRHPESVSSKLCSFLQMEAGCEATLQATLRSSRPQQTQEGSANRVYSLAATGWSDEQVRIFLRYCDQEMEAFGYSNDERYFISNSVVND
jgi:hypothetical protein